jgi:hypothetical protein
MLLVEDDAEMQNACASPWHSRTAPAS